MKIRIGWVSNSSSCSFIIPTIAYNMDLSEIKNHIRRIIKLSHLMSIIYMLNEGCALLDICYLDDMMNAVNEDNIEDEEIAEIKEKMFTTSTYYYSPKTHTYAEPDDLFEFFNKSNMYSSIPEDDMAKCMNDVLKYYNTFRVVTPDDVIVMSKFEDNETSVIFDIMSKYFKLQCYRMS